MFRTLKRILIGAPLHSEYLVREKLPKWKALAIFSSDALSSVAYGPEQIIIVLMAAGTFLYGYAGPIALAILALLAVVAISYAQVARANPGGGGSYSVARNNLGETVALLAAASLFIDYTLTVAVSISSGTDAIVSAFPLLIPYHIAIDLGVLFGVLMLINLRGVRESSTVFVFPTYSFIIGIIIMIGIGLYLVFTGRQPAIPAASLQFAWSGPALFVILRAFASGCSSMTGVEAISNGVPMFKPPEVSNARKTTFIMALVLGVMFGGIAFLILHYHFLPQPNQTMLSQLAGSVLGHSWGYYYIQITTMLILYLAANTSYNGLPPLLSLLARDGYMPRYLAARGDRLVFSSGIVLLSVVSAVFIIAFQGSTDHLIALYALGVFISFTIAQTGMVIHWRREKGTGWHFRALINTIGAVTTAVVVVIIAITKFIYGAWLVAILIPLLIATFKTIHQHYLNMREQLRLPRESYGGGSWKQAPGRNLVLVPIAGVNRVVENTLTYAKMISPHVTALYVGAEEAGIQEIREKWQRWKTDIELIVRYSPYRTILEPVVDYVDQMRRERQPGDFITVLIPEFETRKWWHRLLHNQTGWFLRTYFIFHQDVVVSVVPFRLQK
ncbi:APC family permease [Desulfotomaculum copahuensis]|uniref:Amino acid transporter n=1 Tax=Desulfotomaculum copahuensis TaxID=1838280 RepID=A0A1B7LI26_9FIRM|nr:APC family permease [Desulfotomaculum copahuensis]OAT86073.1 amino acid transporter [Desulfotomaculum copahuensis]